MLYSYFSLHHEEPREDACNRAALNPERVVISSSEKYFQEPFIYVSLFCNSTMAVEMEVRYKVPEDSSAQKKRAQSQGGEARGQKTRE